MYGSMVKRLRLRPLTAATRVRIPIESPHSAKAGPVPAFCFFGGTENGKTHYFMETEGYA